MPHSAPRTLTPADIDALSDVDFAAWLRSQEPKLASKKCAWCDQEFIPYHSTQRYCREKPECMPEVGAGLRSRRRRQRDRSRRRGKGQLPQRTCAHPGCTNTFWPQSLRRKYCSEHKAPPRERNKYGRTPLGQAKLNHQLEQLIQARADLYAHIEASRKSMSLQELDECTEQATRIADNIARLQAIGAQRPSQADRDALRSRRLRLMAPRPHRRKPTPPAKPQINPHMSQEDAKELARLMALGVILP